MNWSNKRVLVTGAAGFIGSNLTKRLLTEGAYVIVLDDFSYGIREKIPKETDEIIEADVTDKYAFENVKDIDYVFHFAAPSSIILFNENPIRCMNVTVNGLLNMLEWAKQNGVKRLVYPTSGSVYGYVSPPQIESCNVKPANLYGIGKLTCEMLAAKYASQVHSSGLRIFAGYGPGEEHKGRFASVVTMFMDSIKANERPVIYGDGTQSRDFVYITDVVDAIVQAATLKSETEIINVGSGQAYSFNQVVETINSLLDTNVQPFYVKKPVNYLENTLADLTKMKKLLGIKPKKFADGLALYLNEKQPEYQEAMIEA